MENNKSNRDGHINNMIIKASTMTKFITMNILTVITTSNAVFAFFMFLLFCYQISGWRRVFASLSAIFLFSNPMIRLKKDRKRKKRVKKILLEIVFPYFSLLDAGIA